MEAQTVNPNFLEYVKASKDLNPVIKGKPYALPAKQGEFFFHYRDMQEKEAYREKNFYWMHNFKVLLTNGEPCMPKELLDELSRYGGKNFFYISFNAFYEYEAFANRRAPTIEAEFTDPECVILTDEAGKRIPFPSMDGTWRYEIAENHKEWLINPENPLGGRSSGDFGGYYSGKAYFYDYSADPNGLANFMAKAISAFCEKTHYNGVFFDYCTAGWKGSFLPKRIVNMFALKYGYVDKDGNVDFERAVEAYERDAGWYLYLLRQRLPKSIDIFANQAFYSYKNYYPALNHDITESYFVSFAYGRTGKEIYLEDPENPETPKRIFATQSFYRGLKDSITDSSENVRANTAEDTVTMKDGENTVSQIVSRALPAIRTSREFTGCPNYYFLDYMIPRYAPTGEKYRGEEIYRTETDREAIFYSLAWHRLFDCEGSISDWYGGEGNCDKDDLYFVDLGKTFNTSYLIYDSKGNSVKEENAADYAVRFFENGFVLVSGDVVRERTGYVLDKSFIPAGVIGLYDMFERRFAEDTSSVVVNPNQYEMLKGYVNPNNPADIDDGYRPVGRVFMYVKQGM